MPPTFIRWLPAKICNGRWLDGDLGAGNDPEEPLQAISVGLEARLVSILLQSHPIPGPDPGSRNGTNLLSLFRYGHM